MHSTQTIPRKTTALGIAIDIGATTVAAYLVDLEAEVEAEAVLASAARLNGQRAFGTDESARIEYALRTDRGAEEMAHLARADIQALADGLLAGAGATRHDLRALAVVGSAAMLRLFEGRRPGGEAPEGGVADSVPAASYGLPYPSCRLVAPISSVAGIEADLLAAMRTARLEEAAETTLLIDLGGKGAVALTDGRGISCCAVAAGPPLEGPSFSCGTGGVGGAIDRLFWENGRLRWTTIGGEEAVGLCASGVLDAAACLVRASLVDASGALDERWWASGYPLVASETADLRFTQADLRHVQLAKAAVAACIDLVLEDRGIGSGSVERVLFSGGFGGAISGDSAAVIGLLPAALRERASWIGNAAGLGAVRLLLRKDEAGRAAETARRTRVVDPAAATGFDERFSRALFFPAPGAVLDAVEPAAG